MFVGDGGGDSASSAQALCGIALKMLTIRKYSKHFCLAAAQIMPEDPFVDPM